jgi:hypothetical protein
MTEPVLECGGELQLEAAGPHRVAGAEGSWSEQQQRGERKDGTRH